MAKPYVWGGTRPDQGFDCSGLVFYAYNKILEAKLPRTANEMYHYRRATIVANNDLRRGRFAVFPYPQPRDCRPYGRVFGRWAIYRVATYRRNHSDKPISRTFLAGPFFGRAQDFDGRDDFCRPDKAFTPHPAVVRRCLMRRWRVLSCLRAREYLRAAFPI